MEATHDATAAARDDLPRALANSLDSKLMDVITLLRAASREANAAGDDEGDADRMTNASSRAVALISMADEKVREVIRSMAPYV